MKRVQTGLCTIEIAEEEEEEEETLYLSKSA